MKLIYAANARFPSEKAHPYQIMQMCEAFAANGAEVTLLRPYRQNPPELRIDDIWAHYGVQHNFTGEVLPGIDLYPIANHIPGRVGRALISIAANLSTFTFNLALIPRLARERNAVIYSRDPMTLMLIAALWTARARRLIFEAHTYPATGVGLRIRRWLAKRIGGFVVITEHLRQRYEMLGVPVNRIMVAHDGFSESRFALPGDRAHWREKIGWPGDAFIVGYMGRFHTLGMDKGLGNLIDAVIELAKDDATRPIRLGLVGGPDEYVDHIRAKLEQHNLPTDLILYAGQIPAPRVPGYLRAFDVCTMPFPWTEHFAYYASPMKLFEYMASGSPVVATDLPSTAEIICDGENGLLIPPGDAVALAAALRRLRDEPDLAQRLAASATQDVQHYTWGARARAICTFVDTVSSR
jgi:glycosyltransferase involved in cell wall biosynthesis